MNDNNQQGRDQGQQRPLRATGAKPSRPDDRDFRFEPEHYGAPSPAALPPVVDLRGGASPNRQRPVGPVRDQGQLGACVGFAATSLRAALRVGAGAPFVAYSPLFTYWEARSREGTTGEDTGCEPRDAFDSLAKNGACREDLDPYNIAAFTSTPTPDMLRAARPFTIASYHALSGDTELCQAIAGGAPVLATIRAGNWAFQTTPSTGVVSDQALANTDPFDHAILIAGYDQRWWYCENSWGEGWGDAGYFFVKRKAIGFFGELWTGSLWAVA